MAKKERFNFSLHTAFVKAVQDIACNGLDKNIEKQSASSFLEKHIMKTVILPFLQKEKINPAKFASVKNNPELACAFFVALRSECRGELGYKIYKDKTGIIGIEIPCSDGINKKILL